MHSSLPPTLTISRSISVFFSAALTKADHVLDSLLLVPPSCKCLFSPLVDACNLFCWPSWHCRSIRQGLYRLAQFPIFNSCSGVALRGTNIWACTCSLVKQCNISRFAHGNEALKNNQIILFGPKSDIKATHCLRTAICLFGAFLPTTTTSLTWPLHNKSFFSIL